MSNRSLNTERNYTFQHIINAQKDEYLCISIRSFSTSETLKTLAYFESFDKLESLKTPLTFNSLKVLTLKNFTISSYFESFEFSDFEKFTSLRTLKTFEKIH